MKAHPRPIIDRMVNVGNMPNPYEIIEDVENEAGPGGLPSPGCRAVSSVKDKSAE
jgi:hypothetical protein